MILSYQIFFGVDVDNNATLLQRNKLITTQINKLIVKLSHFISEENIAGLQEKLRTR